MAKLFLPNVQEDIVDLTNVFPLDGKAFTLEEMQALVAGGGTIEMLHLPGDMILVFDEEGKNKNLPYNPGATKMVMCGSDLDSFGPPGTYSNDLKAPCDFIVGYALLCSAPECGEEAE